MVGWLVGSFAEPEEHGGKAKVESGIFVFGSIHQVDEDVDEVDPLSRSQASAPFSFMGEEREGPPSSGGSISTVDSKGVRKKRKRLVRDGAKTKVKTVRKSPLFFTSHQINHGS